MPKQSNLRACCLIRRRIAIALVGLLSVASGAQVLAIAQN